MKRENTNLIKNMVGVALFSALAYSVSFITPLKVQHLSFDAKDAVLVIASFIYGPVSSITMSLLTSFLEFITFGSTGIWGFIMDFASSCAFTLTASLIYKYKRSLNGAIISLFAASAITTAVMMPLNILITPRFTPVSAEVVIGMIPTLLLPFNFAKTLLNSAVAMLFYKPVVLALKKAKMVDSKMSAKFDRKSLVMLILGGILLAAGLVIFYILNSK